MLPLLVIVASLVSQSLGAAFAKGLFAAVGVDGMTGLRIVLSALLLLAFWRPWRHRLACADIGNLLAYGAMLGAMNLCIYHAFARIPIGIATAIEVTGPLALVLAGARRGSDVAWVALATAGLWLLLATAGPAGAGAASAAASASAGPTAGDMAGDMVGHMAEQMAGPTPNAARPAALDPWGVAFAFGAAAAWAFYIVFGKRVAGLARGQAVSLGMGVAALPALALLAAHAGAHGGAALLAPRTLLWGLAVALLSSALPYSLEMAALRRLPRRVFGILVSATPAVGALCGFFVLGERLAAAQWLGVACIVAASAGGAAAGRRGPAAALDQATAN